MQNATSPRERRDGWAWVARATGWRLAPVLRTKAAPRSLRPPVCPLADDTAEARLCSALAIAWRLARRLHYRLGSAEGFGQDDLLGCGGLAVVEALRDYDAERGPFRPFVARRVLWAMLDAVRRETHARARATRARAMGAQRRPHELARAEPVRPRAGEDARPRARQRLRELLEAHAAGLALGLAGTPCDEGLLAQSPEELLMERERHDRLWRAVDALDDPRMRELLVRHYRDGQQFDAVAEALGISKSWASRLHGQAVTRLATRLRGDGRAGRPGGRFSGPRDGS